MRFSAKFAGAVLGLAVAGLLASPMAAQAAPAVDVDEVMATLGLAVEPADYVILVDTSGSMNANGRYPAVRGQVRELLAGLDADDRVSLLTFDSVVKRRYRGAVGTSPDAIINTLPNSALGDHTDIGAAIDGGLRELEKAETHRLAALILITDGDLDTLPGAKYADVDSAAWKKLKTRATALAKDHEVAGYAVSLLATTDAGLLKKVLPHANEVSATEVGDRFAHVTGDMAKLQAAKALKDELASPITVVWTADLGAAVANGTPVPVQLDVTSPYPHVPVVLSELVVMGPDGVGVSVSGLPDKLALQPGATVTAKGQVTVTGSPAADARLSLAARVTSPWGKVLTSDLGIEFAPVIEGTAAVPQAPIKLPPNLVPTLGAIAALLAVGLVVLIVGRILLTPRMSGLLTFTRNRRHLADIVVNGRKGKLVAPAAVAELAGLSGAITGAWGPARGQRAVRLVARLGDARAKGLVGDGDVIQMGDMEISYITDRRRILDKMGLPATPAERH